MEVDTPQVAAVKGQPKPLKPSKVPVQSPVLSRVRVLFVFKRPEPNRLLKDWPFIMRLVVEAVMKDE